MQRPTDNELMLSVRDGALDKLGELFERHHVALFNYFLRFTRDRGASEDLVQDVFLRMLRYRHTYQDRGTFTVWMYHMARNVSIDHHRRKKRVPVPSETIAMRARVDGSPSEDLHRVQQMGHLASALEALPASKREVLVLSRYQGLKYEEIAGILGCSVGAVKVRVHRAMKALTAQYFRISKEEAV